MNRKPGYPIGRRTLLQGSVAAAASPWMARPPAARANNRSKPNILLLMSDQHRGDCVHADGNAAIHTPNLDRIAAEGVLFGRAYSSTPTCTPARSALLTGLSPWNHGMLGYGRVANGYPVEKAAALAAAGYSTACIGKNHYTPQRQPHGYQLGILDESSRVETIDFRSDYRSWFYSEAPNLHPDVTGLTFNDYRARPYALPEELHPTAWTGMTAVNFLESYNKDEPFFLKVSFARPHSPYDPPKRLFDLYKHADIPEAHVGGWAERHAEGDPSNPNSWHGDFGKEQVRHSRQGYYGAVTFIDEWIGRIIGTLEKRGELENTLIVYLSDHGDMTGDHHLWRKSYAYEASARIPILMRWPGEFMDAPRGQRLANPVEIRDIVPTLMDAAGIPGAEALDGESLLKLARGETAGWREWIDLEHDVCYSPDNHWSALTDGRWKYIYHARDGWEQLFNLDADPGEERDLAPEAEHQAERKKWRKRLAGHLAVRGEGWVKNGDLIPRPERQLYSPNYPAAE